MRQLSELAHKARQSQDIVQYRKALDEIGSFHDKPLITKVIAMNDGIELALVGYDENVIEPIKLIIEDRCSIHS